MQTYLCEKPSQAKAIAELLGVRRREDGRFSDNKIIVTWCVGHLLEMAMPDDYDSDLKKWNLEQLPIIPQKWKMKVDRKRAKQFKVVKECLKQTNELIIATDAGREGEVIAREVLDLCHYTGPIKRLWTSSLDTPSLRKALHALLPGESKERLYDAGMARQRADWMIGINLTRAYTLSSRQGGNHSDQVLSVGRVQTPTLRLVVDRDREIANFIPQNYWVVKAQFNVARGTFSATWNPAANTETDSDGRCTSESSARNVAQSIEGSEGVITAAETERKKNPPPLPHDLSSLQAECSRRYGFTLKQTLDIAQSLYETHKATSYPRTESRYLPVAQLDEVEQTFEAMVQSDPSIDKLVQQANSGLKSKAWNDSKLTDHHAIIPTATPFDISKLSDAERKVYDIIQRHYLVQFYPDFEYDQTIIKVRAADEDFVARGRVSRVTGWKQVLKEVGQKKKLYSSALPDTASGDPAHESDANVEAKQTNPPKPYTDGTLGTAMKSVASLTTDPKLKKMLRETTGIGTSATRDDILETLIKRKYMVRKSKTLRSTEMGQSLIDAVPDVIKDPVTTGIWEQSLDDIANGDLSLDDFLIHQSRFIDELIQSLKNNPVTIKSNAGADKQYPCPECGSALRRRKGSKGFFWGCSGYPECKTTLPNNRGKPGKRKAPTSNPGNQKTGPAPDPGDNCPSCSKGKVILRALKNGKNAGKTFYGCSGFPKCKYFCWKN